MGFPNRGWDAMAVAMAKLRKAGPLPGPVGINIGVNKDSTDPIAEYAVLAYKAASVADYLAVNVSSPNTPGLRSWQAADRLEPLLDAVRNAVGDKAPIWVKVAPDLSERDLADVVEITTRFAHALVVGNTTIGRPVLREHALQGEIGGLSGAPLMQLSTEKLRWAAQCARGRIPLVGVGGVATADDVQAKRQAGASLVQLYTSLAYDALKGVERILRDLGRRAVVPQPESLGRVIRQPA
jgi:dihydroorotate dehydrogenase